MENSKLMQILVRDISEVEKLTEEIRQNQSYDALDIELLITRISGVRHLLELAAQLKDKPEEQTPKTDASLKEKVQEKSGDQAAAFSSVLIDTRKKERPEPKRKDEKPAPSVATDFLKSGETSSAFTGKKTGKVTDSEIKPEPAPTVVKSREVGLTGDASGSSGIPPLTRNEIRMKEMAEVSPNDLGVTEEESIPQEKQILGEKFVAGKSLNDLLLEQGFSDSRFAALPIPNLASAIRTNDRFLFSRELFEGNMESLNDTIRIIDGMGSIQEAAEFLHDKFRWKKSETSLKFIDLVKRRFLS